MRTPWHNGWPRERTCAHRGGYDDLRAGAGGHRPQPFGQSEREATPPHPTTNVDADADDATSISLHAGSEHSEAAHERSTLEGSSPARASIDEPVRIEDTPKGDASGTHATPTDVGGGEGAPPQQKPMDLAPPDGADVDANVE